MSSSLLLFPLCFSRYVLRPFSNSGTYTELRTTSFIESTGVTCSNPINHNRVQVLSIPALLLACSQDWTCNLQMIVSLEALGTNSYNRYAMYPAGHNNKDIRYNNNNNSVEITIKMKTIVWKLLMIKITKFRLSNFNN